VSTAAVAAGLVHERALDPGTAPGSRIAIHDGAAGLSYADLRHRCARVGRWASGWSSPTGDGAFAALVGDDTPDLVATFLGLVSAGWAVGIVDPAWPAHERRAALRQLDPAAIVVVGDDAAVERIAAPGLTARDRLGPAVVLTASGPSGRAPAGPAPGTPFYVGFTSGSAGRPKAFVRSHASWWHSFAGLDGLCPIDPSVSVLVPGTLSSSHFLFGALHALHAGATVEVVPAARRTPERVAERLWRGDPRAAVYVVPTLLDGILRHRSERSVRVDHVFCAGARLDDRLREAAERALPQARLVEYYGASELSFVTIRLPGDGAPPGSVGRAFPGVEVSVRDEQGRPVAPDEEGLVFARGPLVFCGYRGVVASGARPLGDGWWTVGDRGRRDAEGFLTLSGRGSALIITGGANVQPEEVEEVLSACEGVSECAVVGVPDATWGEAVCAVVVVRGPAPSRASLRSAVRDLARHKRPRRYLLHAGPLPRGRTGKVDRSAVGRLARSGALAEL
jgi:acyl-CoA synthetase (AMP-forming)/AMP-acid ligase II